MKKIHLTLLFAALAILTTSSKCGGNTQPATEQSQTDSAAAEQPGCLVFDSVEFHVSNTDSTYTCDIIVDAPRGNDSLALAIRRCLSDVLTDLAFSNDVPDKATPKDKYKGSFDDAQAMVNFYGKANEKALLAEMRELYEVNSQHAPYAYDASIRKTEETDKYITFQGIAYTYLGGAHGFSIYNVFNILKPSGRLLTETIDTTKTKALQPILRKGIARYLNQNGETASEETVTSYLFVDNDFIPLPAIAPYLTADGLRFVYGQYEIGPYALGAVEFTVPYADIKPYLTKETLEIIDN